MKKTLNPITTNKAIFVHDRPRWWQILLGDTASTCPEAEFQTGKVGITGCVLSMFHTLATIITQN